ncbi:hypothetical protein ABW21_db0203455 [Orbilia brochopaga]|nr:hypothetical protein ABW21_db0203455 [Drechslerella brochopaga]
MKFSSIIYAVFGLSSLVSALPAPAPIAAPGLDVLEKRSLIEREPLPVPHNNGGSGGQTVDIVADVQICIDAVVKINKKYAGKRYTTSSCQSWAVEIVAQIKILISVISAYPAGCVFPAKDVCVAIFVKLFLAIFVQLKCFCDSIGGLLGLVLVTVDLLLACLIGLVDDLLDCIVSLCILIEAKIFVGIVGSILGGCGSLPTYCGVIVKLCIQAGLSVSL